MRSNRGIFWYSLGLTLLLLLPMVLTVAFFTDQYQKQQLLRQASAADSTLHLPDYRASERAFSLLTQAAGRAGRGDRPGHVIFQTYDPDNPILQLAVTQDYDTFAKRELQERQNYFYPPFAQMLKLQVVDKDEGAGLALAQQVVFYLQSLKLQGKLEDLLIAGPFPSLVAKAYDLYRFNVLLKAQDLMETKEALLNSEFKEKPNLYFNVDPVSVI